MASYAYHNLEFQDAIELAEKHAPHDSDLASIHLKCLCELDRSTEAVSFGESYQRIFSHSGDINYWLGMSQYLSGSPTQTIEQQFLKSTSLGFSAGELGLAFLAFSDGRNQDGIKLLTKCRLDSPELDHIRCLMLFQGHTIINDLEEAERHLKISDNVLRRSPSLLRRLWGQLCWVRLLRAKGRFEGARVVLERTMDQLDPDRTPRLFRNGTSAKELIHKQDDSTKTINFPTGKSVLNHTKIATITRKPMLNSLFRYLMDKGDTGANKEEIVLAVWQENYNPMIHDDRIYKAVGRLRRLLGDNVTAPNILIQQGRQYVLHL
jgi:hypothetical protein